MAAGGAQTSPWLTTTVRLRRDEPWIGTPSRKSKRMKPDFGPIIAQGRRESPPRHRRPAQLRCWSPAILPDARRTAPGVQFSPRSWVNPSLAVAQDRPPGNLAVTILNDADPISVLQDHTETPTTRQHSPLKRQSSCPRLAIIPQMPSPCGATAWHRAGRLLLVATTIMATVYASPAHCAHQSGFGSAVIGGAMTSRRVTLHWT